MKIPERLRRMLVRRLVDRVVTQQREPDIVIGDKKNPYLLRWYLIPRNRLFNVYLHQFLRSDDDRALHDHPWASLSIILEGLGYDEVLPDPDPADTTRWRIVRRPVGSVVFRPRARSAHRVQLLPHPSWHVAGFMSANSGPEAPCWTLFITGPRVREWGFWCPKGWRHWREFTAGPNGETVGKGCE